MISGQAICQTRHFGVGAPIVTAAYGGFSALLPTAAGEVYNIKYITYVLSVIELVTTRCAYGLSYVPCTKNHQHGCLT